jgi:two-component system cell cycle response regulator
MNATGASILIIEDNAANLELMTYLLSAFGHTVLTAENGMEGIAVAGSERPELIICDVQLPDLDGFEIARRLRGDPHLLSIPLVAVTALAMVGDRDRVLAAGFNGYLAKPIDPETFVRQMEVFLPASRRSSNSLPPSAPAPASSEPESGPHRHTILAVDGLAVNLDLARSILAPSGYRVITAAGITEGLALARQEKCDLILSDVSMSEGTGYELLAAVRADPALASIPVVLLTSTMMTDADRAEGLAMGAARYLRRPIEPEVLLAEIQACLAGRP